MVKQIVVCTLFHRRLIPPRLLFHPSCFFTGGLRGYAKRAPGAFCELRHDQPGHHSVRQADRQRQRLRVPRVRRQGGRGKRAPPQRLHLQGSRWCCSSACTSRARKSQISAEFVYACCGGVREGIFFLCVFIRAQVFIRACCT